MTEKLLNLYCEIGDKNIGDFVKYTIEKHEKQFLESPSSSGFHHAYKGGNYDHTNSVMWITIESCELYNANKDIATAGSILHDIGKCRVYKMNKKQVVHLKPDVITSHFLEGNKIITDAFKENPIITQRQFDEIQHILLSHHGPVSQGHGSIVDPMTKEALIVSRTDHFDANITYQLEHNAVIT